MFLKPAHASSSHLSKSLHYASTHSGQILRICLVFYQFSLTSSSSLNPFGLISKIYIESNYFSKFSQLPTSPKIYDPLLHLALMTGGGLCHWVPQDTFYIKATLSRPGNIINILYIQKQTQGVRQKQETNEHLPNMGIRQKPQKRTQQNSDSNLLGK